MNGSSHQSQVVTLQGTQTFTACVLVGCVFVCYVAFVCFGCLLCLCCGIVTAAGPCTGSIPVRFCGPNQWRPLYLNDLAKEEEALDGKKISVSGCGNLTPYESTLWVRVKRHGTHHSGTVLCPEDWYLLWKKPAL